MSDTMTALRYQRIAPLGKGGMATVYLAALRGPHAFQKLVVVKEMRPDLAEREAFRDMFMQEARLAARLSHPNVVQTFEVLEEPNAAYSIVMEFLDGQPFSRLRNAALRELMLPLQLLVLSQVLQGLEYLHELTDFDGSPLGLIHRDISPQNVFVTYDGDVKILDFGIAKANDSLVTTEVGTLKGKVAYMAPEQVLHAGVDLRADLFSVGVMLWEALAGRRYWSDVPDVAILGRLGAGQLPSTDVFPAGTSTALVAICERALAHNPADRYPSAAAFRADIERYFASLAVPPTRRDVGKVVRSLFQKERRALRQAIDEAVGPGSGGYPSLSSALASQSIAPIANTRADLPNTLAASRWSRPRWLGAMLVIGAVIGAAALSAVLIVGRRQTPLAAGLVAPAPLDVSADAGIVRKDTAVAAPPQRQASGAPAVTTVTMATTPVVSSAEVPHATTTATPKHGKTARPKKEVDLGY
jgi:serine/threonine protein kinase